MCCILPAAEVYWEALLCYDCGRQQLSSCITTYLERLVNADWWVDSVVAEEDLERWELRGSSVLAGLAHHRVYQNRE
jgi:hypothetical protein